jgi:hypothetical protein
MKMTKDEALDLALEALGKSDGFLYNWHENATDDEADAYATARQLNEKAITAIKQARSAPVQEALTWYEGAPPFPQDQEWFIAETIYGDRVVLRSLDEGREHKGNYAFKTADQTYMKQEIVKRWMQFPDCEYLPPAAQPAPVQEPVFKPCSCRWKGEEQVQQCTLHAAHIEAIHEWAERAKTAEAKLKEKTND